MLLLFFVCNLFVFFEAVSIFFLIFKKKIFQTYFNFWTLFNPNLKEVWRALYWHWYLSIKWPCLHDNVDSSCKQSGMQITSIAIKFMIKTWSMHFIFTQNTEQYILINIKCFTIRYTVKMLTYSESRNTFVLMMHQQ